MDIIALKEDIKKYNNENQLKEDILNYIDILSAYCVINNIPKPKGIAFFLKCPICNYSVGIKSGRYMYIDDGRYYYCKNPKCDYEYSNTNNSYIGVENKINKLKNKLTKFNVVNYFKCN